MLGATCAESSCEADFGDPELGWQLGQHSSGSLKSASQNPTQTAHQLSSQREACALIPGRISERPPAFGPMTLHSCEGLDKSGRFTPTNYAWDAMSTAFTAFFLIELLIKMFVFRLELFYSDGRFLSLIAGQSERVSIL